MTYFLKNGEVLEKLKIVVGCDDLDYAKELEVVTKQRLLRLRRGSKICQIEWVDLFSI